MNEIAEHFKITHDLPTNLIWIGDSNVASCWLQISGNVHFAIAKEPNKWKRLLCRWLLGWRWLQIDALYEHNRANIFWDKEI